ncbi:hypothetical protein TWF696_005996 [Orbilia brochopaga]|uniref:Uncharacterized protein n=1 Tax=Orbilia brochopaga TaxID=3140254 RepID=A0AAV9UYU2_9PEZI
MKAAPTIVSVLLLLASAAIATPVPPPLCDKRQTGLCMYQCSIIRQVFESCAVLEDDLDCRCKPEPPAKRAAAPCNGRQVKNCMYSCQLIPNHVMDSCTVAAEEDGSIDCKCKLVAA